MLSRWGNRPTYFDTFRRYDNEQDPIAVSLLLLSGETDTAQIDSFQPVQAQAQAPSSPFFRTRLTQGRIIGASARARRQ